MPAAKTDPLYKYVSDDIKDKASFIERVKELQELGIQKAGADDDSRLNRDADLKEILRYLQVSGLNPFRYKIVINYQKSKKYGPSPAVITTAEALQQLAAESGDLAGVDAPVFDNNDQGKIESATVTIWKYDHNLKERVAYSYTAYYDEYKATMWSGGKLVTQPMWLKMGRVMTAKCARVHALRLGWPTFAGIYIFEEMEQAGNTNRPPAKQKVEKTEKAKAPTQEELIAEFRDKLSNCDNLEELGVVWKLIKAKPVRDALFEYAGELGQKFKEAASEEPETKPKPKAEPKPKAKPKPKVKELNEPPEEEEVSEEEFEIIEEL